MVQATVLGKSNIGLEQTPGTEVDATHRLRSMSMEWNMNPEVAEFRSMGYVIPTVTALNREWATANVTGQPTYDEIVFALASIIGTATPTQPDVPNSPTVYNWLFELASSVAQTPATYTVENVNTDRSMLITYGLFTALNINFARNGISMGGSMIGRALQDGITETDEGSIDELPLIPVLPTHVNLYVDDAAEDIGNTQFTDAFAANFSLTNRYGMKWVLDRAEGSFSEHVPLALTGNLELQVEKNAAGMALLSKLRNSETAYVRIEAVGDVISDDETYKLVIDAACRLNGGSFGDQEGVATVTWPSLIVDDADLGTSGTGLSIEVQNTLAALGAGSGDGDGDGDGDGGDA